MRIERRQHIVEGTFGCRNRRDVLAVALRLLDSADRRSQQLRRAYIVDVIAPDAQKGIIEMADKTRVLIFRFSSAF